MLEFFKESKHEVNEMTPQEIQKMIDDAIQADRKSQEAQFNEKMDEIYQAKFKEQFGKDPKTFLADLENDKIAKFAERKKTVLNTLKSKYNLSPKLVDGYFAAMVDAVSGVEMDTIKFADGQQGDVFQLLDKFGEALAKADEDNTLFVDLDEYAKFGGDEGNPNLLKGSGRYIDASEEELKQLDVEIRKFAEVNKVSYNEAAEKIMAAKR
jgi:predicted ribosome quality control (RQC) complex YloA/Tae2 family protein